jgi:hypothetical protein
MRESVLPEGVMDFLASRRGWFWILSAAGALLLLFVLVTWLRFGLVRVHYTTGDHVGNGRIEARAYDIESNPTRTRSPRSSVSRWCRARPATSG